MMYGTEEWARQLTVTRSMAAREYVKHGHTIADLDRDLGDHPSYKGAEVLDALGY